MARISGFRLLSPGSFQDKGGDSGGGRPKGEERCRVMVFRRGVALGQQKLCPLKSLPSALPQLVECRHEPPHDARPLRVALLSDGRELRSEGSSWPLHKDQYCSTSHSSHDLSTMTAIPATPLWATSTRPPPGRLYRLEPPPGSWWCEQRLLRVRRRAKETLRQPPPLHPSTPPQTHTYGRTKDKKDQHPL